MSDVDDAQLDSLIHHVDLDGLVRLIDDRATDADWAGLDRVRRRCIAATRETGRQLWPAATLAEYRLALSATPEWVATVLADESGQFTIGPLSEVAAVHHGWDDVHPHLSANPTGLFLAHERGLRGDDISPSSLDRFPEVIDIPAMPAAWEPAYPLSTYERDGAEHPEPARRPLGASDALELPTSTADELDDDDTQLAFRQLVEPWTVQSTGRAEMVCVEGDHRDALAALGLHRARVAAIDTNEALAELAWAGASGGAHGRRRGMAGGRFSMWWLLSAITDLDWPLSDGAVRTALAELRWYRWDAFEPARGWQLQLAVANPGEQLAWAFNATDDR